jgi:hypothetical protein
LFAKQFDASAAFLYETVMSDTHSLIEKIKALPPERLDEVEDFVDFIAARAGDRALSLAASAASAPAFAKIWNNPEDDAYDAL